MNQVLTHWNSLDANIAAREILPCCGSQTWAEALAAQRPTPDEATLLAISDKIWHTLPEAAWQEAFNSHPRIGQTKPVSHATEESLQWSAKEQQTIASDEAAKSALNEANRRYEEKFHRIFIVCATGKSSAEILAILEDRMHNDDRAELHEAAEQQRQITHLRLKKWLHGS
jgi:2-oxo-4-hydroxy-4-carboxy-5-ureidoimidazoline decarboxylase